MDILTTHMIFKKHVFVCTEGKTCPNQGSNEVLSELRSQASDKTIRINKAGCLGQCGNGPMVVVYPEGVWYCQVATSDCKELVQEHLGKNQIVERLLYSKPVQI